MVQFRGTLLRGEDGEPLFDAWLDKIDDLKETERAQAHRVLCMLQGESRERGLLLAELLIGLQVDFTTVLTGLGLFATEYGELQLDDVSEGAATLAASVHNLASINTLPLAEDGALNSKPDSQAENIRSMLVALINDPRTAVVKLGEVAVRLRFAKDLASGQRLRLAREGMEFFAPLAGRLGIWHLKWVIEDLSFRFLHANDYTRIASKLEGTRDDRERLVEAIRQDLEFRLDNADIQAEVQGRAKNIYSIWQKMQQKGIDFEDVLDVQAVRVLVNRVDECYRVLGIVHTSWPHVSNEFDDYIANPKENGYRSIHTAVMGPQGKMLEVQIRTHEMHEEAELGVCAHWAYKGDDNMQSAKLDWMRDLLDWHREFDELPAEQPETLERVYVTTPKGHVVSVKRGSTPVDFAFRVHTDIGYRCRGARVDDAQVPLNTVLKTGQSVEIITADEAAPRREWLDPSLGYVATGKVRSKIQAWFKELPDAVNIEAGRDILRSSLGELALKTNLAQLAEQADYGSEHELLLSVGVGEAPMDSLLSLALEMEPKPDHKQLSLLPLMPDEEAPAETPPEIVRSLEITCNDRSGLMRDIAAILTEHSTSMHSINARIIGPDATALVSVQLRVASFIDLAKAIHHLRGLPDVVKVRQSTAALDT